MGNGGRLIFCQTRTRDHFPAGETQAGPPTRRRDASGTSHPQAGRMQRRDAVVTSNGGTPSLHQRRDAVITSNGGTPSLHPTAGTPPTHPTAGTPSLLAGRRRYFISLRPSMRTGRPSSALLRMAMQVRWALTAERMLFGDSLSSWMHSTKCETIAGKGWS